jgi:hypothetical protein
MPTCVVTDVEADGLVPGRHSMISIGSVAVDESRRSPGAWKMTA